jgi:hypothetical protein
MNAIASIAKSIAAFCTTLAGGLTLGVAEQGLTGIEVTIAVLGSISAAAIVWAVPNADDDPDDV